MLNLLPVVSNAWLVDALVLVVVGLYILDDVRNGMLWGMVQLSRACCWRCSRAAVPIPAAELLESKFGLAYALAKPGGVCGHLAGHRSGLQRDRAPVSLISRRGRSPRPQRVNCWARLLA